MDKESDDVKKAVKDSIDPKAAAALKNLLSKPDGKEKLYQVLKALSAMRLTKEDSTPSPILNMDEQGELSLSTMACS